MPRSRTSRSKSRVSPKRRSGSARRRRKRSENRLRSRPRSSPRSRSSNRSPNRSPPRSPRRRKSRSPPVRSRERSPRRSRTRSRRRSRNRRRGRSRSDAGNWSQPRGRREAYRPKKPEGCKTIWVGWVDKKPDEEELQDFFKDCGHVVEVRCSDRHVRGYFAHVQFENTRMVDEAMRKQGDEFMGVKIQIDYAYMDKVAYNPKFEAEAPSSRRYRPKSVKPPNGHTLWVGDVSIEASEQDLIDLFEPCGEVEMICLQVNQLRNGKFGHIKFFETEAVDKAAALAGSPVHGVPIRVDFAEDKPLAAYRVGKDRSVPETQKPEDCRTIWVGGLPGEVVEDELRDFFVKCGEIREIRLDKSKRSGTQFCHIEFAETGCVDRAIRLSGERLGSAKIRVDYAENRGLGPAPANKKSSGPPEGWHPGLPPGMPPPMHPPPWMGHGPPPHFMPHPMHPPPHMMRPPMHGMPPHPGMPPPGAFPHPPGAPAGAPPGGPPGAPPALPADGSSLPGGRAKAGPPKSEEAANGESAPPGEAPPGQFADGRPPEGPGPRPTHPPPGHMGPPPGFPHRPPPDYYPRGPPPDFGAPYGPPPHVPPGYPPPGYPPYDYYGRPPGPDYYGRPPPGYPPYPPPHWRPPPGAEGHPYGPPPSGGKGGAKRGRSRSRSYGSYTYSYSYTPSPERVAKAGAPPPGAPGAPPAQ